MERKEGGKDGQPLAALALIFHWRVPGQTLLPVASAAAASAPAPDPTAGINP